MNKFLQMLLLTSIMVLSSVIVQAQSLSKLKKSALDYFYDEDYESALGNYEKLIIRDSLEPLNFYYAGICLIELGFNTRSIPYFEKAEKLKLSDIKLYYYLGHSNHLKHNFDVAIKNYEIYKQKLIETAAQDVIEINKIDNYIKQCNVGKLLSAKPLSFKIENLGSNVNSQYPEYIPLISTDEKTIIFTTRRPENEGGKKDPSDLLYFEDVYVSKKENGKWQPPLHQNMMHV
jgi:tetratricopeptide (TPR) repeat protein